MEKQSQINHIHETIENIFTDLSSIHVCDEQSRESKQHALLSLVSMRRFLDSIGMWHIPSKGGR